MLNFVIENLYSPEINPVANNMRDVEQSLTNLTNSYCFYYFHYY